MNLLDECCSSKRREDSNSDCDGQINFCLCLERFLTGCDTYVTIPLMHSLCINFYFFLLVDLLFLISNLDSQTGSQ